LTSGGPDEGGVGAVGVIAVGVAPRVDKVWVGVGGATDHRRFWLEVAFGGWGAVVLVRAEEIGEESLAGVGVSQSNGRITGRWIGHRVGGGVRIIIGVVAVACGLKGGDFGFRGGGGAVAPNGTSGTESEAGENADDGDDGEEFDEGERRHGAARG